MWHRFLGFTPPRSEAAVASKTGRPMALFEQEELAAQQARVQQIQHININVALEKMMGPGH